jgi:CBS domain containing-hemolysin-like protein/mannitol/fructose-specific phosphotransferase system IIA component (Ntr-type)
MDLVFLLIAAVLILLNAFFAMAEYSLVRIRASRLEELVREGRKSARLVQFAVENIDGYLSAVQLGITMTSLGLGWVGEPALANVLRKLLPLTGVVVTTAIATSVSFVLAFAVMTATHILFGELVPKLIAIGKPETSAKFTVYPMTVFYYLSYVPMQLLRRAANIVLRLVGARVSSANGHGDMHSEEEIKILLEEREEEGELSLQRLLMFENLFDFGRGRVREVMTPRGSIAYLSRAREWPDNLIVILQSKASRYPVCKDDLDSIEGYVHIKDFAIEVMGGDEVPDLRAVTRPILRLTEETHLEEALHKLQQSRTGLAVVVSKRRKVVGLIALEDLLEEIVGEIRDEFERVPDIRLSSAFVPEACELDVEAGDLFEVLRHGAQRLHAAHPVFDAEDALEQVYQREKGLSSALGHETAFPHARIQSLARPLFTMLRSREPMDLKAPDGKPVRLFFMILTPFAEPAAQLRLLSQLARLVLNVSLRERLLEAVSRDEISEVIGAFETTIPL